MALSSLAAAPVWEGRKSFAPSRKYPSGRGYAEPTYGSFERDIARPKGVDSVSIEATYADGILTVNVPVPAEKEESHRVIPVSSGE